MKRRIVGSLLVLGIMAVWAVGAHAMTIEASKTIEGNSILIRDVVEVRGMLKRDAFILARRVDIVGNVAGDVFIIADTVHISGSVDGSARILGRRVVIDGAIGRNTMVLARSLVFGKDARVGWDVSARVATLEARGAVDGNVLVRARHATVDGVVRKGIEARINRRGKFIIGEHASITGDVAYLSPTERIEVDAKAQIQGRINHDPSAGPIRGRVTFGLVFLLGLVVVGAAIFVVLPAFIPTSAAALVFRPAHALLAALLAIIVVLAVLPLLWLTVVGIPLALMLFALVAALLYLGHLVTSFVLGERLLKILGRSEHPFITLLVGLLPYAILVMIPGIGVLARVFGVLFGFGGIALALRCKIGKTSKTGETSSRT
jgi:cytoskeletal protein CcmA (bactofilin family)